MQERDPEAMRERDPDGASQWDPGATLQKDPAAMLRRVPDCKKGGKQRDPHPPASYNPAFCQLISNAGSASESNPIILSNSCGVRSLA
mgnify:CR=1 FL=1